MIFHYPVHVSEHMHDLSHYLKCPRWTVTKAFCRQSKVVFHVLYSSSSHRVAWREWPLLGRLTHRKLLVRSAPSPPLSQNEGKVWRSQSPSAGILKISIYITRACLLTFLPTIESGTDPSPQTTYVKSCSFSCRLCIERLLLIIYWMNEGSLTLSVISELQVQCQGLLPRDIWLWSYFWRSKEKS